MKNNMILSAALLVLATGCKKDKEPEPTPSDSTTATFRLGIGFHWQGDDFDIANTYADGAGNAIKFTAVRFYLSETHLNNGASTIADFHHSFILADAAEEGEYTIGTVPAGSYDELGIVIGLDSATNHADPTLAEAPLNDPDMHWSWNPEVGYKFLVLEGRIDDDGNGVVDDNDPVFTYHCATDDALRNITLPFNASAAAGGILEGHMEVRMNVIVSGVDMLTTQSGMGYEAINAQLMDNLTTALEVE
ncbi:MAG: hypothetical protein JST66_01350 [Bacteroidetes bacterium]|nr:hypothetical protein [Bacteroidota bacterium]